MRFHTGIPNLDRLPEWNGGRDFGLETPRSLLQALGDPQDSIPSVHVAGTNGKGSVCTLLSSILHASGASVGQFASPHLTRVTERCLINGVPVSFESYRESVEKVWQVAEGERLAPSFFEITTAAAFLEFVKAKVEWIVVEVGLGGRLDATNTIRKPRACVVTTVALDHMHILGSTIAEIAVEKAGIAKEGVPLFVGLVEDEARKAISCVARDRGTEAQFIADSILDTDDLSVSYQRENIALASRVAQYLGCTDGAVASGVSSARWPGRLEWVKGSHMSQDSVPVLLDVAHNPHGIAVLTDYLAHYLAGTPSIERVSFIVSFLDTKNWHEMIGLLLAFSGVTRQRMEWVCTTSGHSRAVPPEMLEGRFGNNAQVIKDPEIALRETIGGALPSSVVVVTGSIYLVGRLRPAIIGDEFVTLQPEL